MKRINNKGFTLVELIATIVILSIIMGIGAYSITKIINDSKEKDYELLIKEIIDATEIYYQECRFSNNNCDSDSTITLGFLVEQGYLKGNATNDDNKFIIVNPNTNEDISSCQIKYNYSDGKMNISKADTFNFCPPSY